MSKEETKEVKEETKEEVVEGAAEEKKEPSSDEIIEGLKAELDKAKNDVARAYADTENMKNVYRKMQMQLENIASNSQQRKSCQFLIQWKWL